MIMIRRIHVNVKRVKNVKAKKAMIKGAKRRNVREMKARTIVAFYNMMTTAITQQFHPLRNLDVNVKMLTKPLRKRNHHLQVCIAIDFIFISIEQVVLTVQKNKKKQENMVLTVKS